MATHFRRAMESQIRYREELSQALAAQGSGTSLSHSMNGILPYLLLFTVLAGAGWKIFYAKPSAGDESQKGNYRRIAETLNREKLLGELEKQFHDAGKQVITGVPEEQPRAVKAESYAEPTPEQARELEKILQQAKLQDPGPQPDALAKKLEYRDAPAEELKKIQEAEFVQRGPAAESLYRWVKIAPQAALEAEKKEFPDL